MKHTQCRCSGFEPRKMVRGPCIAKMGRGILESSLRKALAAAIRLKRENVFLRAALQSVTVGES